jgi:thiamine transport system permease protein
MNVLPAGARVARAAVPLVFLGVFFVWPLVAVLERSFDAGALRATLGDPVLRQVAWFTLWQAAVSTGLTLAVGLPAAYVVARYDFPGRNLFRAFVTVPFVLPTVVVATAFLALLRPGGPLAFLHWQRGVAPMIAAHVFFNVAVVVRIVGGFWTSLDPRREEAARMLGASRVRVFRDVTLPLLAPSLIAAASIVFLFTFTSFGVALLLADPAHATLEVEIYRQAVEFFSLPTAAALALVQIVAVLAVLAVMGRAQERRGVAQRLVASADTSLRPRGLRERLLVAAVVGGTVVFLGGPLAVLALRSVRVHGNWTFAAYRALGSSASASTLFVPPWTALRNSLAFAAIATAIALTVGGLAAFAIAARPGRATRTMDVLLMLPLGTSAVTVGLGFLVAFERPPLGLSNWLLVPVAQAVIAVPFVVRSAVPMLRSIDPALRDAAAVLGAPPNRVWREVDLPIVARAFTVAAGFCAAVSLGEFGATLFVARPSSPTIPIAIERFLTRPGDINVSQSIAMATILMMLTVVVVTMVERARAGRGGEF